MSQSGFQRNRYHQTQFQLSNWIKIQNLIRDNPGTNQITPEIIQKCVSQTSSNYKHSDGNLHHCKPKSSKLLRVCDVFSVTSNLNCSDWGSLILTFTCTFFKLVHPLHMCCILHWCCSILAGCSPGLQDEGTKTFSYLGWDLFSCLNKKSCDAISVARNWTEWCSVTVTISVTISEFGGSCMIKVHQKGFFLHDC